MTGSERATTGGSAAALLKRAGEWHEVTPESAGWTYLSFSVHALRAGSVLDIATGERELAIVPLAGGVEATIGDEAWTFGGRTSVFDGLGSCLYVPRDSALTLRAPADAEIAVCGSRCEKRLSPVLVRGEEVAPELRGGGNASRQISTLVGPDFGADRIHVVEVWTPAGNWSSFPPHKHDQERDGEAVLEETFYYRCADPTGFGLQRLYSPEREVDQSWAVADGDLLLVPWGYHTTCAAHGHHLYYLNVLAGPGAGRTLQAYEDPDHAGVRETWPQVPPDPRLPLVTSSRG